MSSNNTRINVKFSELTYSISKGEENILNGVSGRFLSGQLSAILGPSGAGKTTLMNILAGYKTRRTSGDILVNGKPRDLKSFRKQSCYIMQDEQLLPYLTIGESMEAAANLKLGHSISNLSKKNIINDILSSLGLEESKTTRVSNLSGGEKKRLSAAFELINNPSIMFLDEPTSGLDSYSSYKGILLLKKLAREGRNIICTIHQPSAKLFEEFDYVYALAEGHCVYRGTVPGLLPFISSISLECPSHYNPADFMIEVASGVYGNFVGKMVEAVNRTLPLEGARSIHNEVEREVNSNSNECETYSLIENQEDIISSLREDNDAPSGVQNLSHQEQINAHKPVPFIIQFHTLLIRTLISITRDPILTLIRLVFHLVSGLFIGLMYYKIGNEASEILNNVGLLIICIVFNMFSAGITTLITFPLEAKVLVREHLNNWYSLKAYYLAKTLVDLPFQIAFSTMFITIVYFLTDQPLEFERFLTISAITVINALISQSIALAVGAGMDVRLAVSVAPFTMIPSLMFSGFMIISSDIPFYFKWLTYLSYLRYCFEGSLRITYGYNRSQLHCSEEFCYFKYPEKILELYAVEEYGIWFDFLILAVFFLAIRVLAYFVLSWKVRIGSE
ncbi:UNVERIFIED_CONTAM: hypothetical protein RMT77_010548 [Armadillidium vulgare]